MNTAQIFLSYALRIGALELVPDGRELKSKRISPYFFNTGLFNTGRSVASLAIAYTDMLYSTDAKAGLSPEVLFGPAYKGIPLAVTVAIMLSNKGEQYDGLGYAFNRKEAKDHGEGGIIVGSALLGRRVVIIDDVMTTGTSSGEAVEIISANGGIPIACAIAFDRQERGIEEDGLSATQSFTKNYGIPVYATATLDDLITLLDRKSKSSLIAEQTLPKILAYREEYGVR